MTTGRMPVAAPAVRVSIPLHIDRVQKTSLADAGRWRAVTRRAFLWCFAHGYHVSGYYRDEPSETAGYILSAGAPHSSRTP
jgi:predicted GNAT superfamily acetyltransferase